LAWAVKAADRPRQLAATHPKGKAKPMRWSVYQVQPDHKLDPLGRVNAPCHTTALVRAAEKWEERCNFAKPHLGLEVRKWLGDPHQLGARYEEPFTLR
jgi:hypothetical protein